jgi:hypothetical protein
VERGNKVESRKQKVESVVRSSYVLATTINYYYYYYYYYYYSVLVLCFLPSSVYDINTAS